MPVGPIYFERKRNGLCVRCGEPGYKKADGTIATVCPPHLARQLAYLKVARAVKQTTNSIPDAKVDPHRVPWELKTDHLPPLPKVCPRCSTDLVATTIEIDLMSSPAVKCMICGYLTDRQMLYNRSMDQRTGGDDERAA